MTGDWTVDCQECFSLNADATDAGDHTYLISSYGSTVQNKKIIIECKVLYRDFIHYGDETRPDQSVQCQHLKIEIVCV